MTEYLHNIDNIIMETKNKFEDIYRDNLAEDLRHKMLETDIDVLREIKKLYQYQIDNYCGEGAPYENAQEEAECLTKIINVSGLIVEKLQEK